MAGVGRQVFRRTTLHGCCQHKIKTDGTAQLVWGVVGQNAVLQARRKQHQQTRAWGQIPVGLIERVAFSNRAHWDLAPRPGLLVLFPSSLHHSVLPNDAPDELRCSISFDFVLTAPVQGGSPEYLAPHPRHWDSLDEPIA